MRPPRRPERVTVDPIAALTQAAMDGTKPGSGARVHVVENGALVSRTRDEQARVDAQRAGPRHRPHRAGWERIESSLRLMGVPDEEAENLIAGMSTEDIERIAMLDKYDRRRELEHRRKKLVQP